MPRTQRLPLEGIRVIEAGAAVAIPLGGRMLADYGAEVIKIESTVRPELGRVTVFLDSSPGARYWEKGGYYTEINRNKTGVSLDLSKPESRDVFLELVRVSDVLLENFTPRVMENFGLSYSSLVKVCPDLIMVSATGFGHSGPWRNYRAYGFTLEPATGLSHFTGYEDEVPVKSGITYTDTPAAYSATLAVTAALEYRERTGIGQWIDLSQYEVGAAFAAEGILDFQESGEPGGRRGNRDKLYAPQGVYRCQGDDQWLAISVRSDAEWTALCTVIDRPDLAADPRYSTSFERKQREREIDRALDSWAASRDAKEASRRLQAARVPAGLVLDSRELTLDPHLNERGFFTKVRHTEEIPELGTRTHPGPPWMLNGERPDGGNAAPTLGEHTAQVFRNLLGMPESALQSLADAGLTGTVPAGARNIHQGKTTIEDLKRIGEIRDYDLDYQEKLGNR